jgi:hypothetical protein
LVFFEPPIRHSLYKELENASYQAGKSFAELHSKGITSEKAELINPIIKCGDFKDVLKMDSLQIEFLQAELTKSPGEIYYRSFDNLRNGCDTKAPSDLVA